MQNWSNAGLMLIGLTGETELHKHGAQVYRSRAGTNPTWQVYPDHDRIRRVLWGFQPGPVQPSVGLETHSSRKKRQNLCIIWKETQSLDVSQLCYVTSSQAALWGTRSLLAADCLLSVRRQVSRYLTVTACCVVFLSHSQIFHRGLSMGGSRPIEGMIVKGLQIRLRHVVWRKDFFEGEKKSSAKRKSKIWQGDKMTRKETILVRNISELPQDHTERRHHEGHITDKNKKERQTLKNNATWMTTQKMIQMTTEKILFLSTSSSTVIRGIPSTRVRMDMLSVTLRLNTHHHTLPWNLSRTDLRGSTWEAAPPFCWSDAGGGGGGQTETLMKTHVSSPDLRRTMENQ